MSLLGLRLTILAGRTVPTPLPAPLVERVRSVHVTETDEERSVFTLTLDAGRNAVVAGLDAPGLEGSPLRIFVRIVVVLMFGAVPRVLMDGIVTDIRLTPGDQEGASTLLITGEDVSYLLDRVERDTAYVAQDDLSQVISILNKYATDKIVPQVIPPLDIDPPLPIDRIPTQHGTDLEHIVDLAHRHGYVAYAIPGPAPGESHFYWGPPVRVGAPQPALSVDLGPETNVLSVGFRTAALAPTLVSGAVLDRRTGAVVDIRIPASSRPPLAAAPLWATHRGDIRERRLRDAGSDAIGAFAQAQAQVDRSIDAVIAEGALDGARYGGVLRPRGLVGMRGAGLSHDGLWYVRRVEHVLVRGSYRQNFTLAREGYGSTVPSVPVGGFG